MKLHRYALFKPMHQYQNLTDVEQIIPNVGVVAPNGTIETDQELNNPNFKRITTNEPQLPPVEPVVVLPPVQTAPELPQTPSEHIEGEK